jgi:hypothetical protein
MSSLLHEVEESLVALEMLAAWLQGEGVPSKVTIVDLCCGKGVFSMLLSFLGGPENSEVPCFREQVSRILMVDKMSASKVNWRHIREANADATAAAAAADTGAEGHLHTSDAPNLFYCSPCVEPGTLPHRRACIPIDIWDACNIHEVGSPRLVFRGGGGVLNRIFGVVTHHNSRLFACTHLVQAEFAAKLNDWPGPLAIVGIHLCKGLSPRCVGLFNTMGPTKVPFLCLAPCCLPRLTQKHIRVDMFENPEQLRQRAEAEARRARVKSRVREVGQVKTCWKCGEVGHGKTDCPSTQLSSRPAKADPPAAFIDVQSVKNAPAPFDAYCEALMTTIQAETTQLRVVTMEGTAKTHDARNWNQNRKCSWLVASR